MRYTVPVSVVIESPSGDKALESAQAIKKLLDEPMVKSVLSTNGVDVQTITVFQPLPKG